MRRELLMLPYFTVFDHLAFRVDGGTITLAGWTTRPTLRSSAENVVRRIEGVTAIDNRIQVLPLSPFDDRLRVRLYRAIYGHTALNRYALNPNPPIRIIVNNGHVILEGVVAHSAERDIASMQANGVPEVFSVRNNLRVER